MLHFLEKNSRRHYPSSQLEEKARRTAVKITISLLSLLLLAGCSAHRTEFTQYASLTEARRSFHSHIVPSHEPKEPVEQPPPGVFRLVKYPTPGGDLAAYITPDLRRRSLRHPCADQSTDRAEN